MALARRQGCERKGDAIHLPMTRTDIADYLGLTIETVSRGFTRLRKEGLIATPDAHSAVLNDPAGLRDLNGDG